MRKLTTSEFIKKAQAVHGDTYDYSKTTYLNSRTKVTIICKKHGEFEQNPRNHMNGFNCYDCGIKEISDSQRKTREIFIKNAQSVHGVKYDYSKVNYINTHTKVSIICLEHGKFEQTPNSHLKGRGCMSCSGREKYTNESFIKKAKQIHGDIYYYSKVDYINAHTKITITCKDHGEFEQSPNMHLLGRGCPECGKRGYSKSEYIELAERYHNGMSNLYLIRMSNETEDFVKIGISVDVKDRLRDFNETGYNVELIASVQDTAGAVYDFENELHREYKEKKYVPKISFRGQTECFTSDILPDALKYFA